MDHNTRGGTHVIEGPRGRKYHYEKSIPASQLPGGNVAGTYTIWVKDGNGERDSQNHTFTLHGNQGLVWLVFDQNTEIGRRGDYDRRCATAVAHADQGNLRAG